MEVNGNSIVSALAGAVGLYVVWQGARDAAANAVSKRWEALTASMSADAEARREEMAALRLERDQDRERLQALEDRDRKREREMTELKDGVGLLINQLKAHNIEPVWRLPRDA